jgi:hypothetical protein
MIRQGTDLSSGFPQRGNNVGNSDCFVPGRRWSTLRTCAAKGSSFDPPRGPALPPNYARNEKSDPIGSVLVLTRKVIDQVVGGSI